MYGRVSLILLSGVLSCIAAWAQAVFPPAPEFPPCDLVFDIPSAAGNQPIDLHAEFRSPHQNTGRADAFWDGGTRWVIRYTAAEAGTYNWRLTSAIAGLG